METITTIAIAMAVIGAIMWFMFRNMKKSKMKAGIGMGVAIVGILILVLPMLNLDATDIFKTQTISGKEGMQVSATCSSETSVSLDINAYDKENPNTANTEATNLYRKVGNVAWNTWTLGTAITSLEPGADYEFVIGITTTDFTDNAYGEKFVIENLDCKEAVTMDKAVLNDEVETSLTATFYNQNHDASAQTMTAGQTKTVFLKFEAGKDEVFGNPNLPTSTPNVICMDLNSTAFDKPESVSFNGKELNRVPTPIRHAGVSTDIAYCYEAPVITDLGQEIKVQLKADDTNAPGVDETAYLYAGNWFVTDDGDVSYGVETEEGTAVGTDASDSLTIDLTA